MKLHIRPTISQLPDNVLTALQQGETIEAIKLLRQATGLGLKEAKDLIDEHLNGNPVTIDLASTEMPQALPSSVIKAINEGNKIEAIKLLREETGKGLKEAKDLVDAAPKRAGTESLSPGEVPRSNNMTKWIIALIILGIAVFLYLQGSVSR